MVYGMGFLEQWARAYIQLEFAVRRWAVLQMVQDSKIERTSPIASKLESTLSGAL